MAESRALSSFEGTYNSLRDIQKTSNFDQLNGFSQFNTYKNTNNKPNRAIIDTKTYLDQLEKKYSPESDDSFEEQIPKKAPTQVPSKFMNKTKQNEFHLPKDLTLSKGPSEQCVSVMDNNNRVLQDMQQKYLSNSTSVIIDQDGKRRFFELAVQLKNQLPKNHAGQDALVAQLHSECMKKQIPERYWKQWLTNRLEN